jgi:DNA mismatch repair protein MutS
MGDFYELFFDDAEIASRALGIALTKRGKHAGQDIPMCGVPVHSADDYLQKLIGLGHRVAVCEQLEDPAEAKKRGSKAVVRRDVTRLVTPSTITEEKLLDPGATNWLVAIGRAKGQEPELALAAIDISTGGFRLIATDHDTLAADLHRVAPAEIVLPEPLFHAEESAALRQTFGRTLQPLPAELFDSQDAERRLCRQYGLKTLDGAGHFARAELSAAGGALAYVEKTQIAERPLLQLPSHEGAGGALFIDPATRANLELERTLSGKRDGSLLAAIDRTVTGPGARLLCERLRAPLTSPDAINARLDAVGCCLDAMDLSAQLRTVLKNAPDMERALARLSVNRGGPRDLAAIRAGLDAARKIAAMMPADGPPLIDGAREALARCPDDLLGFLHSALDEDVPLFARDGGFVRAGHDPALDELRALRDESRRIIAGLQARYAEETGVKSLKIKHNNVLGYFIEVTALNAAALNDGDGARATFIHRQTLANQMRFTTTELADLESRIANAAGQALTIELSVYDALCGQVLEGADTIRATARALAEIDVQTALAELAEAQVYVRPVISEDSAFEIEAGRHPVVEQALRRQGADPFVANDCALSPPDGAGKGAIKLLTGPNMGGKSTYLRQNAMMAILAQAGCFVPAASARIGVVTQLFSRVGASDDLAQGRSTFMVEMVETAAILNQARRGALVILDEIGRGTATFDGLSIAWATLEYLHENNGCRTLFATHFHEMTALSASLDRVSNLTMQVREWEGDVIFLHQVAEGAADRSYGIQVGRLAGLPLAVVERARAVLDQLEAQGREAKADRLIDDLPLFSAAAKAPATPKAGPNAVEKELAALLPDEMTPRDALDALYRLKALLASQGER